MKNSISLLISFFFITATCFSQSNLFSPSYVEGAIKQENQIGGTARYKALSGAMSSLGGELSAIGDNPAGIAVFNHFEGSVSIGVNSSATSVPAINGRNSSKENNTQFVFNQIGGVFVFNNPEESEWKNFSFGINSQNVGAIDQSISVGKDPFLQLTQDIPNATRVFKGYNSTVTGSNYRTNLAIGGNYQNNLYIGASLDFYNSTQETFNEFYEEVNDGTSSSYNTYVATSSPLLDRGNGIGLSLGIIYKPIQEVRLGLSYKSPVWQTINRETPNYALFNEVVGPDTFKFYDQDGVNLSTHDLTTPAVVTLGGSYVFNKKGLISVDYSFKDYRGINISPTNIFRTENSFVDNVMQSTSTIKIGAEYRANDVFTLRGGYRLEQSPFDYNKLESYKSQTGARSGYWGDLTGLSFGFGAKLRGGWYLDGAYNYFSRSRELFIYGRHLDLEISDTNPDFLKTDFSPINEDTLIIDKIKEINHNFSLTLGFRF